jgi:hypothetical protein
MFSSPSRERIKERVRRITKVQFWSMEMYNERTKRDMRPALENKNKLRGNL